MRILTNTSYAFIERRRTAYLISGVAILIGALAMIWNVASIGSWVDYGVDFTGGTLVQVEFTRDVTAGDVRDALGGAGAPAVAEFGDPRTFVIRAPLAERVEVAEVRGEIEAQLEESYGADAFRVTRTELVGPTIGAGFESNIDGRLCEPVSLAEPGKSMATYVRGVVTDAFVRNSAEVGTDF